MMLQRVLYIVAFLPWAAGILVAYWLLEPLPVRVLQVYPRFLSQPVADMADAYQYAIEEAVGGSTVYRLVSYCVDRPFVANMHRSWVNEAMVWHAPSIPTTLSRESGCRTAAIAVPVPTSNPARDFEFVQSLEIDLNPVRTAIIDYAPIPLRILANK